VLPLPYANNMAGRCVGRARVRPHPLFAAVYPRSDVGAASLTVLTASQRLGHPCRPEPTGSTHVSLSPLPV
jgi:hypothetical protein